MDDKEESEEDHPLGYWRTQSPLIGISSAVVVLTIIATVALFSINGFQQRARLVDHTHIVLASLGESLSLLKDAQVGARGYVITGQPTFLAPFEGAKQAVPRQLAALRLLTADNKQQLDNIDALEILISNVITDLEKEVSLRRDNSDPALAVAFVSTGESKKVMDRIRSQVSMMQAEENVLLAERSRDVLSSASSTKALILFGTAASFLMLFASFRRLLREIRQRKRADNALIDANLSLVRHAGELETSNKELESFSYSISHDLRIPLRAISGYARMLEEDYIDKIDSEGQRLLTVIRDNSKRMGDLIDDLLTFSKLGRKPITATEVDMQGLVDTALAEIQRRGGYAHTEVALDALPPAWGDRSLLQQVWINLISNAFKYSGNNPNPVIRITGKSDGTETVYAISDNGAGFDMQYYSKLFGVFQRLHSADEFPGTGVGLAIVQRIVTRHGGRVWAEGKINAGATFRFVLPSNGEKND